MKALKIIGIIWSSLSAIAALVVLTTDKNPSNVIPFILLVLVGMLPLILHRNKPGQAKKEKVPKLNALTSTGFVVSKKERFGFSVFYVDDVNKKFALGSGNSFRIFNFSDLITYELNENGSSIIEGKGLATAVGGVAFGVVGALVGASGKRKIIDTCSSLVVRITVNDLRNPQIVLPFLMSKTKKGSFVYTSALSSANRLIAILSYIENSAHNS